MAFASAAGWRDQVQDHTDFRAVPGTLNFELDCFFFDGVLQKVSRRLGFSMLFMYCSKYFQQKIQPTWVPDRRHVGTTWQ
jgi:hypothetical protein